MARTAAATPQQHRVRGLHKGCLPGFRLHCQPAGGFHSFCVVEGIEVQRGSERLAQGQAAPGWGHPSYPPEPAGLAPFWSAFGDFQHGVGDDFDLGNLPTLESSSTCFPPHKPSISVQNARPRAAPCTPCSSCWRSPLISLRNEQVLRGVVSITPGTKKKSCTQISSQIN